ncbi:MAG: hypothetical protein V3T28_04435 [Gemmatimonadales bacterium]
MISSTFFRDETRIEPLDRNVRIEIVEPRFGGRELQAADSGRAVKDLALARPDQQHATPLQPTLAVVPDLRQDDVTGVPAEFVRCQRAADHHRAWLV